jgi:hypothetical protein
VDKLDPNVVLGLFTWSDKAPSAHREIDIEFARWANAADPTNAQYVVQAYGGAGHLARFTQLATATSTHLKAMAMVEPPALVSRVALGG